MDKIKHAGIIVSIEARRIQVRIVQTASCASCKVAGHCNASESKEKLVDVIGWKDNSLKVGDHVTLVADANVGFKAVTLAFVVPFVLLLVVLFAASNFLANESMVALLGVASLVPYFLLLYVFRSKIARQLAFSIEPDHVPLISKVTEREIGVSVLQHASSNTSC